LRYRDDTISVPYSGWGTKLVELENAKNLAIDANAAALAVEITKELAQLSKCE